MLLKYPLKNIEISQKFGEDNTNHKARSNFYTIFGNKHPGIDFDLDEGTPIYAAYPGIVVRKEFHVGMGNVVGVRFENIVILYAHLNEFKCNLGDILKQGDLIGLGGNTGKATQEQAHLHFETRDISKDELKNMVFNPPFNRKLNNLKDNFIYKVNNKNTQKTLGFLALRYFGKKDYWGKIWEVNKNLNKNLDTVLPEGTEITIPNY
jgi:murein DD-endopeptidase MepM/ murein hydrolase activator NlpD